MLWLEEEHYDVDNIVPLHLLYSMFLQYKAQLLVAISFCHCNPLRIFCKTREECIFMAW